MQKVHTARCQSRKDPSFSSKTFRQVDRDEYIYKQMYQKREYTDIVYCCCMNIYIYIYIYIHACMQSTKANSLHLCTNDVHINIYIHTNLTFMLYIQYICIYTVCISKTSIYTQIYMCTLLRKGSINIELHYIQSNIHTNQS